MSTQFSGILTPIYTGGSTASTSRWRAVDYIDRVLIASPGSPVLFWPAGSAAARPLPGLPDSSGYDGVEVFDDHVLLWRGPTLKWSDRGDFANWIPQTVTPAFGRGALESDVVMGSTGSTMVNAPLKDVAGEFVTGQFIRIVSHETNPSEILYDYFRVRSAALESALAGRSIKRAQSIPAGGTGRVYLHRYDTYLDWAIGARLRINGTATKLEVTGRSRNASYSKQSSASSSAIPGIGGTLTVPFAGIQNDIFAGDVVSVGPEDEPGQDLYEVVQAPSFILTLRRLGVGDRAPGTVFAESTYVSFQNYVEVTNTGTEPVAIPPEASVTVVTSLSLEPLGFTGGTQPGRSIPAGAVVETVNANESGEMQNVGASVNGDILGVVTLAEFAYVLKERCIQSIQSVGPASGTFFFRPEILDEGPAGKYAWTRCSDREIAFVGSKGIYVYGGGQNLRAVCSQHWDAFRDEVDWARADEIVAHHNRRESELWFAYPTHDGATKVLVWNYSEDSVVVDSYPADLNGITALGRVDWELAPTWESLDPSEKCNGSQKRWYEYVDTPEREYTLIAIGGDSGSIMLGEDPDANVPRLLVHGRVWSRSSRDDCNPQSIPSVAETPDFDFGDPAVWKYADTLYLALHGRENVAAGATLTVSIGGRDNLLSPVRWSSPQSISVSAAGAAPTKINATVSGRYIRLRFESNTVGSNWGISGYHLYARMGGTY